MTKWDIEYTDTFCGESNYSWVKRAVINLPDDADDAKIKRAAKKEIGISGMGGRWESYGEAFTFHPYNSCTVLFVNFNEN